MICLPMIRRVIAVRGGAGRDRPRRARANAARARELSRQCGHGLRRLPHAARAGGGFDMEKRFSGGSQTWDEAAYTVQGSNITPDRETGIGSWSAADLKRLLTDGMRPSGVPVAPQMPFVFYKISRRATSTRSWPISARWRRCATRSQPPVYKAAMHASHSGRREAVHRRGAGRSGQARVLSRHHRALHGVPRAAAGRHAGLPGWSARAATL